MLPVFRTVTFGCFDITENYLTIRRFVPDGGDVFVTTGEPTLFLCNDQMGSTTIRFANNSLKPQIYNYVITNTANQIIEVIEQDTYTFSELPRGANRIWGVAFTGNRLLVAGDNLSFSSYSDACFDLSNNFLEIVSDDVFAGTVTLQNGSKSHFFCLGSDEPTLVEFQASNQSNSKYQFVLTDFDNRIIQFLNENTFEFKSIGAGSYRIWGISYTGDPIVKINENLLEKAFSDDCFDITAEPISIIRDNPFAGQILAFPGFGTAYTCPINDDLDFVKFEPRNAVFLKYAYVVTDTLETIINFSFIDSIDFGLAPVGVCRVYGVSFEGEFTARIGNKLRNIAFSDECWDLSNNYVEIIRTVPMEHSVFTSNGESSTMVCVGDGGADEIGFTTDDPLGIPKAFVATDLDDNILSASITSTLNFENAPPGQCKVYSVAYTGQFQAVPGTNIHSAELGDDCFIISNNFVTVDRIDSGPLCVVSQGRLEANIDLFKINPNPATVRLNIFKSDKGEQRGINRVELFNLHGQRLNTIRFDNQAIAIPTEKLAGIIIVKLSNNQGEVWMDRVLILQ